MLGLKLKASTVSVRQLPEKLIVKKLVCRNSVTEFVDGDDAAHQETWTVDRRDDGDTVR